MSVSFSVAKINKNFRDYIIPSHTNHLELYVYYIELFLWLHKLTNVDTRTNGVLR